MDNYKEFLTISRQVMLAFIPEEKRSKELINFFLEGATDYQILSILVEREVPLKYDSRNEKKLLTELYSQLSTGVSYLNEQEKLEKMKSFALTAPTAPLAVPAYNLLKTVGSISGASAVAAKLGAGATTAAVVGGIGTLVLVTLLVYAAWKTYQRYFSKAARHCKGLKWKARTKCIVKYKLEGRRKQYADLVASKSACSKSKTPVKCHRVMDEKIAAVNKKINKLREKIEALSQK
jgi:hypothetical protein